MQFKIFNMSANFNNQIERAGFIVNSYEEISSYALVNSQVNQSVNKMLIPKDYKFDGSIWNEIQLPAYYERLLCLMRNPELSFHQLWDVYITTSNQDDEIGSLSMILNKYNKELLFMLNGVFNNSQDIDRKMKKKLQNLYKTIKSVEESLYTKQIIDIIDKIIV